MKLFAALISVIVLTAAALQSRAAETNTTALIIGTAQVADNIGKQVTVTGVVAQVSFRPSIVFLNFDKPYPKNTFTAIIRSSHTNEFENLSTLKGKAVSVKGKITEFNGKPEIQLTEKAQLKVLKSSK